MKTISTFILVILAAAGLNAGNHYHPSPCDSVIHRWAVGANFCAGYGANHGLDFGYYDVLTGQAITVDPGAAFGLNVNVCRHFKSLWIADAQLGFSKANALSGTYDNISSTVSRGLVAELDGGVLFFTHCRHRLSITVGPVLYTKPVIELLISDPDGPGDATFTYKSAFGGAFNATYIFVLHKIPGQFNIGLSYHQVNFNLGNFTADGQVYSPDMLNPSHTNFRNPDGSNISILVFGYQYTFD